MSSQLTPLVFNDIVDVFIFIFIMQIIFNVRFLDPAFSRLLLGLLGDGRRKVARPKWFTPCDLPVMTRPTGRWKVEPMVMEKAPSGDRKSSGGCRDRLLS